MTSDPAAQTFDGVMIRSLLLTGRKYRESFRLAVSGTPVAEQLRQGEALIAEYDLGVQPKLGPVALYSRSIRSPLAPAEAHREYFSGNRDSLDVRADPTEVDLSPADAMSDGEFWQLIDLLGGDSSAGALGRLTGALGRLALDEIGSFQIVLANTLHALDTPLNTVSTEIDGRNVVSSDASLYLRCRIVARGQAAYELALESPPADYSNGSSGERLLTAAANAYEAQVGHPVTFVGQASVETGDNRGQWGDRLPEPPARREPISRERYLASLQTNIDMVPHDPDDVWFRPEYWRTWYGIRYMVGAPGDYTERLVFFGAALELPEEGEDRARRSKSDARAFLMDHVQRNGESLAGPADFVRGAIGRRSHELFSISRTSPLGVDDYLARYVHPVGS